MFRRIGIVRLFMWVAHLHAGIPGVACGTRNVGRLRAAFCRPGTVFSACNTTGRSGDRWAGPGQTCRSRACVTAGFATTIAVGMARLDTAYAAQFRTADRTDAGSHRAHRTGDFRHDRRPGGGGTGFPRISPAAAGAQSGSSRRHWMAAAVFGGLHFSEYGDSWRSALLVTRRSGLRMGAAYDWVDRGGGGHARIFQRLAICGASQCCEKRLAIEAAQKGGSR